MFCDTINMHLSLGDAAAAAAAAGECEGILKRFVAQSISFPSKFVFLPSLSPSTPVLLLLSQLTTIYRLDPQHKWVSEMAAIRNGAK